MTTEIEIETPILKWVGGKTQILTNILKLFPAKIENYYEPFIGGGSVLLGLLSYIKVNKIKVKGTINAYDANEALIAVYKNIQQNPISVYQRIDILKQEY